MAIRLVDEDTIELTKDWLVAVARYDFTGLERRVLDAVIYFTWLRNVTKAQMTIEDIRYFCGAAEKLRTDRITEAVQRLLDKNILFRQELVNGGQLLGVQPDYNRWNDKMSDTLQGIYNNIYINKPSIVPDKTSIVDRLLAYATKQSNLKLSVGAYRAEKKFAKRVYMEALRLTREPVRALEAIKDFIDTDDFMRANVKHQFTYIDQRFTNWYKQIPPKPQETAEMEEALGKRYRYHVKNKRWEPVE